MNKIEIYVMGKPKYDWPDDIKQAIITSVKNVMVKMFKIIY